MSDLPILITCADKEGNKLALITYRFLITTQQTETFRLMLNCLYEPQGSNNMWHRTSRCNSLLLYK